MTTTPDPDYASRMDTIMHATEFRQLPSGLFVSLLTMRRDNHCLHTYPLHVPPLEDM